MSNPPSAPITLLIIAIASLIWNLVGCATFIADLTVTPEMIAQLPADQQMLRKFLPTWLPYVYGVAVFTGAIGCIGLILRKKWAVTILLVSFVAVLIQMGYTILFTQAVSVYGPGTAMISVMVIFMAGFLYFYARNAAANRWLA